MSTSDAKPHKETLSMIGFCVINIPVLRVVGYYALAIYKITALQIQTIFRDLVYII